MKTATEILEDSIETHRLKNADYDDAWRKGGYVLYYLANEQPVTLETPEDWIAVGLFFRRLDKLSRSFNAEFLAEEMNFERAVDSDTDNIPYAAMQAENKLHRQQREVRADGGKIGRDAAYEEQRYVEDQEIDPRYEEFYQNIRA